MMPEVRRVTEHAYQEVEALRGGSAHNLEPAEVHGEIELIIKSWAESLMEKGIEVKGLWLADFDNGSGYYCWRYPEHRLDFYHSHEDGFAGRMRIQ